MTAQSVLYSVRGMMMYVKRERKKSSPKIAARERKSECKCSENPVSLCRNMQSPDCSPQKDHHFATQLNSTRQMKKSHDYMMTHFLSFLDCCVGWYARGAPSAAHVKSVHPAALSESSLLCFFLSFRRRVHPLLLASSMFLAALRLARLWRRVRLV